MFCCGILNKPFPPSLKLLVSGRHIGMIESLENVLSDSIEMPTKILQIFRYCTRTCTAFFEPLVFTLPVVSMIG